MKRPLIQSAAIFGIALAIRLTHALTILRSPAGDALVQDARAYVDAASLPAAGPSFLNLGYPYALAAIFAVFGKSVAAVLVVQAVLGAASCALLAWTARRLFERDAAGWIAGLALALYRPAVFYDALVLTPSLTNVAVVWGQLPYFAISGASVGAAALLRSNALLMAPFQATSAWLTPAKERRARAASAVLLGAALVIAPVLLAQRVKHGAWIPLSTNGGMNFWTGNHRGATGAYAPAPFVDGQNAGGEERGFLDEARRRTGRSDLGPIDAGSFWLREGLREIGRDVPGWLALEGRKLILFVSRIEMRTNVSIGFHEALSPILAFVPIGFPLLFAAGVAGLTVLLLERRWNTALLASAPLLAALLTCLAFFVSGEYRHLAAPGLALAAGALAIRRGKLPIVVGVVALGVSLASVPAERVAANDPAIDFSNVARAICADDPADAARAEALLDRAPRELARGIYVDDARLWVRVLAARDGSRESAVRALDAAETLMSKLPELESESYSRDFRRRVRSTLADRLQAVTRIPVVDSDPALRARTANLLARVR